MRNVITGDDGPWSWATGTGNGAEGRGTGTVLRPRKVSRALGGAICQTLDVDGRCP
ncbi:hypothetical protein [Streptomyces azureus]|nr:hypothetical protein [Streptomyces azureus]